MIRKKLTAVFVVWSLAVAAAVIGFLPVMHIPACALLVVFLICYDFAKPVYLKVISWIGVFGLGLLMALYRPEGFSYFNSISVDQLHEQGKPFQQFINLGKFFAAVIILIWLMLGHIPADIRRASCPRSLLIVIGGTSTVVLSAVFLLDLVFLPKFSQVTLIFLGVNLVITCFAEETFYRLVVQRPTETLLSHPIGSRTLGVLVAGAFFTLTHQADLPYVLVVMMIAGTVYAITYAWTRSLAAAIGVHFSVNALHFMFLPYPI